MSDPRCTIGELAAPQLMSKGAYSLGEIPGPDLFAAHVHGDDLSRAEDRVHALPIDDRARAREVVLVVNRGKSALGRELKRPRPLPIDAIERLDEESDALPLRAAASQRPFRRRRLVALPEPGSLSALAVSDLRRDEHTIAPHDRRRHADALQARLPRDVLRVAPRFGQPRFAGSAGAGRPAPLRPVVRGYRDAEQRDRKRHGQPGDMCRDPHALS